MRAVLALLLVFSSLAKIHISEVVPHSDVEDGYYDYVELFNGGKTAVDIGGHYLSDKGSEPLRCRIKLGTVLQPGQHKSFSFQGPGDGVPLIADCPFRLSKLNDHIYYGWVVNGKYEMLDDANIGSTINRVSNQRWKTSDDKTTYHMAFPTENFDERYPIVGPFIISEIVWAPPAGEQQYVKITCIFGKTSLTGSSSLGTRGGYIYQLRFEEHKDIFTDSDALTPAAFNLPTSVTLETGESFYVVSGNPGTFAAQKGISASRVGGPWSGKIRNATSGNVWVGMFGQEHGGVWINELVRWKPDGKDGWRPLAKGGIQRVSKNSVSSEPDNWIGIGNRLPCNMSSEYPASDCPHIDHCTANFCVAGFCQYDALVCNHPNWDLCYPDYICKLPAPGRYNAGCRLTSSVFGHTTGDSITWGFYGTVGDETKWYDAGCINRAIDCDVGKWNDWSKCKNCQDNQTRDRDVQTAASKNPAGKACPVLNQERKCNYDGKCKPCDYLKCTLPQICWPNMTSFTATCETPVPCVLSDLLLKPCSASCGGGNYTQYREVVIPAKFNGSCVIPKPIIEPCAQYPCPIDCKWSDWTLWSTCPVTCDGATHTRNRTIKIKAQYDGKECTGVSGEEKGCSLNPCPVHCEGSFSDWTQCDCIEQTTERSFSINVPAQFGGTQCAHVHGQVERVSCNVPSCKPVNCQGTWSNWSSCSCENSTMYQEFTISVRHAFGGEECPPDLTVNKECDPVNCPNSSFPVWAIVVVAIIGPIVLLAVLVGVYAAWTASASAGVESYTAY